MSDYDADAFDVYEAAGWAGKGAASYDALAGRVTSRLSDPLLEAVGVTEGTRLLDVATGPGYVAARAVERGASTVGLDFSPSMVEFARSRLPGIGFVEADATALPFDDDSFDAVVAAFVLLHLGRPELAAREAVRVVRPGGRAAFTVWDVPARGRWLGVLLDAVAAAGATPPDELPAGPPIFRFADEREFGGLLTDAGLVDVDVATLDLTLELESSDELWLGLLDGTVRVGPLVNAQPHEVQRAIRAQFDALMEPCRTADGFELPVAVKLGSGTKP
jgi:SAM-dependent methyltransferase